MNAEKRKEIREKCFPMSKTVIDSGYVYKWQTNEIDQIQKETALAVMQEIKSKASLYKYSGVIDLSALEDIFEGLQIEMEI